jgi:hypothetical protein
MNTHIMAHRMVLEPCVAKRVEFSRRKIFFAQARLRTEASNMKKEELHLPRRRRTALTLCGTYTILLYEYQYPARGDV